MPFGETRIANFDAYLKDNAIPIDGLSQNGDAPGGVTIQFRPEATAEQISWAENAKANYDWRRRRPLSRNTIVNALSNLTSQQQNAILRHVVCFLLRQHAAEAASIDAVLGTSLPVEEVDPTEVVP